MSLAILAKSIRDAWLLLAALCLLIFIFAWLQIWLASMISLPDFSHFLLNAIPEKWERLSEVPFRQVATTAGRVALTFVHPVVTFTARWRGAFAAPIASAAKSAVERWKFFWRSRFPGRRSISPRRLWRLSAQHYYHSRFGAERLWD